MNSTFGNARIAAGSDEDRHVLARFFLDSYADYDPEKIEWPALTGGERARLTRFTFWQEAVSTENVTSNTVSAAAALEADPEIRQAIELQGFEEKRHARLLAALTQHYGIDVDTPPRFEPQSLETDFLSAGFGECFDSFFAFGLFALAKQSGFFAPRLIDIFEPVIQEEARHILFFVNWIKYRRSQLAWWKRPFYRLLCGWIILKKVVARARTARSMSGKATGGDDNFTLTARDEFGVKVTLQGLLDICLRENARRMDCYDSRLLRPRLVPYIARCLHKILPANI
jgi:hypothetical protein